MSNSFRVCTPGETFSRVSPFLGRLGITRLGCQTGLDHIGIPVWSAYAPNSKAIVIAQGKGIDDISAKTSAMMEAIERAVATQPSAQGITASQNDLQSRGYAVDCLDILLSSRVQPIAADERIRWAQALDLTRNTSVFVPFDAVHLDRTSPDPRFWISSDGLASGNNWQEAVLHGLLERVERDACVLWDVRSSTSRYERRVEPARIESQAVLKLLDLIQSAGFELALFDVTSDLAIPAMAALLRPRAGGKALRYADVTFGAGASLYPDIAASRAICEAVQSRMTFIAGARDDLSPDVFSRPADPLHLSSFHAPYRVDVNEMPMIPASSLQEALSGIVSQMTRHGVTQLYAVDLSPEWLPASVVKVFAPQLEHPDGERRTRFGSRALSRAFF